MQLFNWTDYHFTRHGMFAYTAEDSRRIIERMRLKKSEGDGGYVTFEENLQHNANAIQKKVIQLLRPIAKKNPDQFIDGAIQVWLKKSLLGENVDVSRSYEKIIQMLICVYHASENTRAKGGIDFVMPVYQVISSMIKFIQKEAGNKKLKEDQLVNVQRWTKTNPPLNVKQTMSETLLNSFLYFYLLFNPTMFDPLFEKKPEEKNKEYNKVYTWIIKYFNVFKLSRNPFTVCWLLEVLNIVTLKWNLIDAKLDSRLKKEYHDMFNNMLTNCSSIISDTFNIEFNPKQTYNLSLPPTVYELLWRNEYITFKCTINEETAQFN